MNDSQLRCFHHVAQEQSFTRAAKILMLRQPTVSAQIAALEKGYGVQLLTRHSNGVTMTALGEQLYALTRQIYDAQAAAQRLLAQSDHPESGSLRIGTVAPHHVMPILSRLRRSYPEATFSVAQGNSTTIEESVRKLEFDVGIVANIRLGDPDYHVQLLRRDNIVLQLPVNHRLAEQDQISFRDLEYETILIREEGSATRRMFLAAADSAEVALRQLWTMQSREAIKEAAANGLGIAPLLASEAGIEPRCRLVSLNVPCQLDEYVICHHAARKKRRLVRAFLAAAQQVEPPCSLRQAG